MIFACLAGFACNRPSHAAPDLPLPEKDLPAPAADQAQTATAVLAGGCFWCTEAVFEELRGVQEVVSGYAGGAAETANYEAVCSGRTKHAEVIAVTYDPSVISYGRLLQVFFSVAHDPTQLNRQGNDKGPQYRSAVFYASPEEKAVAEGYIKQLDKTGVFPKPIATTLEPLVEFFRAEKYHQDYARINPNQGYVFAVAYPKVLKTREKYAQLLKDPPAETASAP